VRILNCLERGVVYVRVEVWCLVKIFKAEVVNEMLVVGRWLVETSESGCMLRLN